MLNFKQFMANAGAFLANGNDYDHYMQQLSLPDNTLDLPTTTLQNPVKIFRIRRTGKTYEICAENNVTWNCPSQHYEHLLRIGKAPHVGDNVKLTFFHDGTVKSFQIVN